MQPVITARIYVLHIITIALKFMYNVNSELLIYANTVCLEAYVSLLQASDSDSNFAT